MLGGLVKDELADDDAGLDGLAQPDLVTEEVSRHRVTEHSPGHLDLVRFKGDGGRQESGHSAGVAPLFGERSGQPGTPVMKPGGLRYAAGEE